MSDIEKIRSFLGDVEMTTGAILEAQSRIAVRNSKAADGLVTEDDTAMIFQSWTVLREYATHLRAAFNHPNANHAVAIKTNPHKEVLKALVSWGFGLEAASYEELLLATSVGATPDKLVFDGPVKRTVEINKCNDNFPGLNINVNCLQELARFPAADKCNFNIGIRINPMVDTGAPAVYHVSGDDSKFGTPISDREDILGAVLAYKITTLHVHAGSSMKYLEQSTLAVRKVVELALEANERLAASGETRRITTIDMGGGLLPELLSERAMQLSRMQPAEITALSETEGESVSTMYTYACMLRREVPQLFTDFALISEFGQWVHFHAGFAVSEVEYVVAKKNKSVAYIHLGADYFMRDVYTGRARAVSFYVAGAKDGSYKGHLTAAAAAAAAAAATATATATEGEGGSVSSVVYDIAGPLCVAGDYLRKDLLLLSTHSSGSLALEEGDTLVILGTGSNSLGMWSRHCSRTIPKVMAVGCVSNAHGDDGLDGLEQVSVLSQRWNPFVEGAP